MKSGSSASSLGVGEGGSLSLIICEGNEPVKDLIDKKTYAATIRREDKGALDPTSSIILTFSHV